MVDEPDVSKYPQFNLNTGVSLSLVFAIGTAMFWVYGIKSVTDRHTERLAIVETQVKEIFVAMSVDQSKQFAADLKLEARLVRIEIMLQDFVTRKPAQ